MDWAGTAVDYGCFAPLNAFLKVFSEEKGIDITYRQAREPMGLLKIDHIKAILSMPEVNEKFRALYKRDWNKGDVDEMYASFEKHLFASLKDFTTPIPGVLETMAMLCEQGIKIGSTTGYTAKMMEIVRPGAEAKGYRTPATVCLAIPLYEQMEALKKNIKAILAGILSGVLTSLTVVLALALIFNLNHKMYVTLLPKSITTAIGMGVSEELGGAVTITVAVIIITGVLGNMLAETLCKLFHIEEPIAKGISIGSASHAIGTAKAMEMGDVEGAMSSLSIAVAGILTVVGASIYAMFI